MLNIMKMKTINDLIKELEKLDTQQKKMPFVLYDTEHNQEFNLISLEVTNKNRIEFNVM